MLVNGRSWGLPRRVSSAVATCALIISSGVAFGVVGSPGVAGADVNVGRNPVAVVAIRLALSLGDAFKHQLHHVVFPTCAWPSLGFGNNVRNSAGCGFA